MRGPTPQEILETPPPELRLSSATTRAYLDMRRRILSGEFAPDTIITPKVIQEQYQINSNGIQLLLLRLAMEGLVKVLPVRERNWRNNAALTEYRIADLNIRNRVFSTRQGDFVADISQTGHAAYKEKLELRVEYADDEIARLLDIDPGDKVIFYRNLQRRDADAIMAISDTYIPFWFADVLPELDKPKSDLYALMRQLGKNPTWCLETVDVVQASSIERQMFELSPDDPTPMLKILRQSFDGEGNPLDVQFLTDRSDMYRLHYSFPLYAAGVPEPLRDK